MYQYYYRQLGTVAQACYQKLLKGFLDHEEAVPLGLVQRKEDAHEAYYAVLLDHPELYFLDVFGQCYTRQKGLNMTFHPVYAMTAREHQAAERQLQLQVRQILSTMTAPRTPYYYCRHFHNFLVRHVTYDYTAYEAIANPQSHPQAFNCLGPLLHRTAVCAGIARAFLYLCNQVGVDAWVVSGEARGKPELPPESHAWNMVLLEGKCHHVDCTWDVNFSGAVRSNRLDYFFLPDEALAVSHSWKDQPQARGYERTYFAQTGRLFSGIQPLMAFLDREIRAKQEILCFRIMPGKEDPKRLGTKIDELVKKKLQDPSAGAKSYLMGHNSRQNTFYYKITW